MQIPTKEDWLQGNPHAYPGEVEDAMKNFFGKGIAEAEQLFLDGYFCYMEDFMWMPPIPFRYYIHAYINHLKSENGREPDDLSIFLGTIKVKLQYGEKSVNDVEDVLVVWERIEELFDFIQEHGEEWYDWMEHIYGNLDSRIREINQLKIQTAGK